MSRVLYTIILLGIIYSKVGLIVINKALIIKRLGTTTIITTTTSYIEDFIIVEYATTTAIKPFIRLAF